ncbi:hypothetical protein MB46_18305 [Arthrobacter alpinus]|uniref:AAA domain-containing protein n=1 Tax=Arthrobacter alpinus TaxID=656366 RepID=UPI0005C91320|nr:AAA domain-containing protein [Arthrobacter alpinus]ALV47151.1 hypothetical protein MB46_18305 [Arthrobacter alpinus]
MIDPRRQAVLVRPNDGGPFTDKTADVVSFRSDPTHVFLSYKGRSGQKEYRYRADRVAIVGNPAGGPLDAGTRVAVCGTMFNSATEAWRFDGPEGSWWRIFDANAGANAYKSCPDRDISFLQDAAASPRASGVLEYWRRVASGLAENDPLRRSYERLNFVDSQSALSRYLKGEDIAAAQTVGTLIFPFSANLSQREALGKCLSRPVSVIDGPPGTGKTQTILNLVANIIATPGATVGVVSFNNSAVDNVREKLEAKGFGCIVAGLGRQEKREEFFARQTDRNAEIDRLFIGGTVPMPLEDDIAAVDQRLQKLQQIERHLAQVRQQMAAHQLERQHFLVYLDGHEPAVLDGLPLLQQSSGRILDYLAETSVQETEERPLRKLLQRIKRYFRFGSTKGIDPRDNGTVLRLQRAYYDNKIAELQREIDQAELELEHADIGALASEHQRLSEQALRAGLQQRYFRTPRRIYSSSSYRQQFADFTRDYPVILSTCHSLSRSLPEGFLLDYLIIDEASQVNLLAAGLAMKNARNIIVVGDLQQIQHIADTAAGDGAGPSPAAAYDYLQHNILSSQIALHGENLPRTMLREHYRCDPAIIGFCNKKFYNGELVPYTASDPGSQPLRLVRTTAGNHMRSHDGTGKTNQREIDVVAQEVIQQFFAATDPDKIGIATPYRLQAGKFSEQISGVQSSTVHKFQGREKEVVIMSTVLDSRVSDQRTLAFVDDPHLVNVAVSRAEKQFVLVTNHDMLPWSRHLRDLVHYIQYNNPGQEVIDSDIVSVFDLLYKDYSARLKPLARRLEHRSEYASENIIWRVLHDILAEQPYADLTVTDQVSLFHLLPDFSRLTSEQAAFAKHRATTFDFVVYNSITNRVVLAVEVDGFEFHENNPQQQVRDAHKNAICSIHSIPLLRLPTTGSGEERLIRQWLDARV